MNRIKFVRYFSSIKFIKNEGKWIKSAHHNHIKKEKIINAYQYCEEKHFSTKSSRKEMVALKFYAKEKKLKLEKHKVPKKLSKNDVLVQVHYAGICGTDLHILAGEFPCYQDGLVLGHEFSGIIVGTGKNVKTVKIGDKVCADPNIGCNKCKFCRTGRPHFCPNGGLNSTLGIFRQGGWRQFAVVPEASVHKIPKKITLKQAALVEPMSCLAHAWQKVLPVPIGSKILVLGSGIIGNLFICLLHHQGHKKVIISEPSKKRRDLVENLGTGYNVIKPKELKELQKKCPNLLFDLIFDASGKSSAIEHAFTMLNFGGKICVFGVSNPEEQIAISPFLMFERELTIIGVVINPFSFPRAIKLIEAMGPKYIDYDKLGVQTFKIKDYKDAIKCLKQGDIAKATFKLV